MTLFPELETFLHTFKAKRGIASVTIKPVDYIPFINSAKDCELTGQLYGDAVAVARVAGMCGQTSALCPTGPKKWLDGGVDALDERNLQKLSSAYQDHFNRFPNSAHIADHSFRQSLTKELYKPCELGTQ